MKIRIKRANTTTPETTGISMAPHYVLCMVFDYIDELRQQAKWDTIKSVSP